LVGRTVKNFQKYHHSIRLWWIGRFIRSWGCVAWDWGSTEYRCSMYFAQWNSFL